MAAVDRLPATDHSPAGSWRLCFVTGSLLFAALSRNRRGKQWMFSDEVTDMMSPYASPDEVHCRLAIQELSF